MKIKVKRHHIKDGVRCDGEECPVTLAIMDALGITERGHVQVNTTRTVTFSNNGFERKHRLPPPVRRFIRRFDNADTVKPFEFTL